MGNGHHGFTLHEGIQAGLYGLLHFGIQGTGGFIKQQYGGVFKHHSGNGNALTLTARQLNTTLADVRIVSLAPFGIDQTHNKVVRLGTLGRRHHVGFAGIGPAV